MKKWLNYLPTIFILSIVLSLVFYSSQGSTVQMNYTQFEKIVDEVDFKKSSMTISSTVIHLEGTYEQNSKTIGYKVIVPRTEKNIEKLEKSLQRNGGKLTVEDPNQGSVWISILSQIIPFFAGMVSFLLYLFAVAYFHIHLIQRTVNLAEQASFFQWCILICRYTFNAVDNRCQLPRQPKRINKGNKHNHASGKEHYTFCKW